MAQPNQPLTNQNSVGNTSSGQQPGSLADPTVQRIATGIYKFDSDKTFGVYERSETKQLPKSLFYDAATSDGVSSGLFAYYVLGKGRGGNVPYHLSDKTEYLEKITPLVSRNPTARAIIETTSEAKNNKTPGYLDPTSPYRGQVYNVKDFIFCKHYGIIPNNRMLTLRRFPHPTLDSLRTLPPTNKSFKIADDGNPEYNTDSVPGLGFLYDLEGRLNSSLPVAQAVTYFGEGTSNSLSNILNISTGLIFASETQEPVKNEQTGDPGLMNSPFGDLIKAFVTSGNSNLDPEAISNLLGTLTAPERQVNRLRRLLLDQATQTDGPLSKKIFVNLNTVNQMMVRKQGFSGGMESFSITFEYNLTSVGTINSKLLFLDLMANLLSLGSDYGQFLSPELRLEQTNVGLGFPGGAKGYVQSITNPIQYLRDQVSGILNPQTVNSLFSAEKSLKTDIEQATNDIKNFINDPTKPIPKDSKFYSSIAVMLSDAFLKRIYYQPLMLSGYPTGDWHLVVGNPLNPIAMIGNLVCTNVKIEFNEDLGPDDFPTGMKVTYQLNPGRQRHRGDWESMFNRGNGRLYLGQLVESKESTDAFITSSGLKPNDFSQFENPLTEVTQQAAPIR